MAALRTLQQVCLRQTILYMYIDRDIWIHANLYIYIYICIFIYLNIYIRICIIYYMLCIYCRIHDRSPQPMSQ